MSPWKIIPIMSGEFPSFEKSGFTYLRDSGKKIKAPIPVWLLQNGKRNILVDTGIGDPGLVEKYHYPVIKHDLEHSLRSHNVTPNEIDLVIWTHLHWDHCQNVELFEKATFIVQKTEIKYAISPLPVHRKAYEIGIKGLKPNWLEVIDRIEVVDGDVDIMEGIKVFLHPGHSPGFQSILVDGKYLIAGDNIPLLENWNVENPLESIPNGVHGNLADYYKTFQNIKEINAIVLPGHDYAIFEQPYYD